jgi:serine/threonine-protein kinase
MEHVDASPVSERLSNGLPAHEALSLLKMAAAGLDHAHSKGVIHPGLGPSHLLVDSTGLLKIAGFEMSSLESFDAGAVSIAEAELLLSSVPYRAPELLFGEIPEGRSDQFSLAAIAFMLLAGDQNSNSDAPILAMADIVSNARFNLAALDTRFNSGVRRVIEKALAFEAAGRYSSCSAFVDALETACLRKSASMTRLATPEESVRVTPQSISLEGNIPGSRPTERPSGNRKKSHFKGRILLIVAFSTVFVLAGILLLLLRRSSTPTVTRTNPASFTPPSSAARAETDLSTHELSNKVKQHPGNQAQIDQSAPPASEDLTTIPPKPKLTRKKAAKAAHPEPKLQGPDIKVPQ